MKTLLPVLTLLLSLSSFADVSVDVTKLTVSLDKERFESCLGSLQPHSSGAEFCVIADIPAEREFLADDGLLATLRYVQMASRTTCGDGGLYTGVDQKLNKVVIITGTKECLQKMNKWNADLGYPYRDKSVYLIKK